MIFMNDISPKTTRNSVIAELSFGIQETQRGKRKKKKANNTAWLSSYCFLFCSVFLLFSNEIHQTCRKGKDYYNTQVRISQL